VRDGVQWIWEVVKVEVSDDGGSSWRAAELRRGSWRLFLPELASALDAKNAGKYSITARATDEKGNVQPDEAVWNAGGYLWNKIEKQELVAGKAN